MIIGLQAWNLHSYIYTCSAVCLVQISIIEFKKEFSTEKSCLLDVLWCHKYFLDGYALEEIQISVAETRISILPEQPLFVTGGWRHPAPPTCCAMQEKPSQNLHKSPAPLVPVCSEKDTCGTAPLQHQLHSNRVKICNLVNKHQKIALTNITNRRQYSKLSTK